MGNVDGESGDGDGDGDGDGGDWKVHKGYFINIKMDMILRRF